MLGQYGIRGVSQIDLKWSKLLKFDSHEVQNL